MKTLTRAISVIILSGLLFNCNPNKYFNMPRKYLTDIGKLRIDGFYVKPVIGNDRIMSQITFYENGSLFLCTIDKNRMFDDYDSMVGDSNLIKNYGYSSTGIFQIKGDSIVIERNIITDAFWKKTKITKHGKILNDTTFVADIYGERIDTFRFVQHDFKPDSSLFEKYKYIPKLKM